MIKIFTLVNTNTLYNNFSNNSVNISRTLSYLENLFSLSIDISSRTKIRNGVYKYIVNDKFDLFEHEFFDYESILFSHMIDLENKTYELSKTTSTDFFDSFGKYISSHKTYFDENGIKIAINDKGGVSKFITYDDEHNLFIHSIIQTLDLKVTEK
jgi:hypothetical protein